MINPGVVTLASLNNFAYVDFPYRFCIEDNIGESIHIHYKDIRLDLTIQEFRELAEKMTYCIDELIKVDGFSSRSFAPVHLVEISKYLPLLRSVESKEVFLEDIIVDTFDDDGNPAMLPLKYSRVYKALCGIFEENNRRNVQYNYFKKGEASKMSNMDRVLFNLEQIKKHGYPYKGEYIRINEKNEIADGQHRAACLYFLHGNIKVPVKILHFESEDENAVQIEQKSWSLLEHELWEKSYRTNAFSKKCKDFIWAFATKFGWCTWNKSEWDKSDILNRLDDMKNRINNIEKIIKR